MGANTQPVAELQLSVVHRLESSQTLVWWEHAPVPGSHVSSVQASPSSQDFMTWAHPVFGSQESTVQAFPSSQFFGVVPEWHWPARQ